MPNMNILWSGVHIKPDILWFGIRSDSEQEITQTSTFSDHFPKTLFLALYKHACTVPSVMIRVCSVCLYPVYTTTIIRYSTVQYDKYTNIYSCKHCLTVPNRTGVSPLRVPVLVRYSTVRYSMQVQSFPQKISQALTFVRMYMSIHAHLHNYMYMYINLLYFMY